MSLLDNIKDAGVIGAGGAGFPTHAKLSSKADFILLNGAECEPLLRVDQQIMKMYPDEILKGFEEARELVQANKGIIGIKGKHKEVISILKSKIIKLQLNKKIEVKEIPDIYPAGDEQVLVYELTGRVVPEAGIPLQVGCVVVNSETTLNIYNASIGKAVTRKYVTVSGDVPNAVTVAVPVGTRILDVLKLSGITDFHDYSVIDGGPMMGPVMKNLDGYITKKNKGFVILKNDHPLIKKKSTDIRQAKRVNRSSCEQCRMCTDMCPRYLLGHSTQPHKMMRALAYNLDDVDGQKIAQLCCQCNLCELFSCPAGLYPKAANMYFKDKLLEKKIRYKPVKNSFEPRTAREYRLVPSKRLIVRLGLKTFDRPAPFIETSIEPEQVSILRRQHVGAPVVPNVVVGDKVKIGALIGDVPEGNLGAPIHASISGTITEITDDFITIRRD